MAVSHGKRYLWNNLRNTNLHLALEKHVHSVDLSKWWSLYFTIKTDEGLKRFSFVWSRKSGWNVYKRDFIKSTPSVFVRNDIWDLKQLVNYVKSITVKRSSRSHKRSSDR